MQKPVIEWPQQTNIQFSISYSGEFSMIGLTQGKSIGVDLEVMQPVPEWQTLSTLCFHPAEMKSIQKFPQELQESQFLRIWTRKEAVLKCTGTGLNTILSDFSVIGDAPDVEWDGIQIPDLPAKTVYVRSFDPLEEVCGSVAIEKSEQNSLFKY